MARVLMVFSVCLLLPLLLAVESESRKLLRLPHMPCNASSATATVTATAASSPPPREESREKEECKGKENEHSRRWMEAHADYIYTQDLEP